MIWGSALETNGAAWLEGRRERLHDRLREVRAKLAAGRLEGVRLENIRLKITPYDPLTPPAGGRLDRALDALMPRIRITDLLWDVNARTGFLDAFTDLRSRRVHSNPAAFLDVSWNEHEVRPTSSRVDFHVRPGLVDSSP